MIAPEDQREDVMDAFGFAFATAFLATVFTIFGIIDRLLVGLASEIRYSVAPAMVSGVRAWADEALSVARRPSSEPAPRSPGEGDGEAYGQDRPAEDRRDTGLTVPVARLPHRGRAWHWFAGLMGALLTSRRRSTPVAR